MSDAPKFEVGYDPVRRRLRWMQRGFWTMADLPAVAEGFRAAIAPLGPPPHRIDCLCDARDFPVQSREVSDALGAFDRMTAAMRVGRFAVVVASVTNKLQVQRTLQPGARTFATIDEAEAWLDQPEEGTA